MTLYQLMKCYSGIADKALKEYLPSTDTKHGKIVEAMEYSLLAGGKRIRPLLTLEFCRICGGEIEHAIPFACAVEMIHTYSLIHDDLPCMDDDDLRRGRPSCHIQFGEDMALLAGDALLTLAFETILNNADTKIIDPKNVIAAAGTLARFAGVDGMVGGQVADLLSEGKDIDIDTLNHIHLNKTSALIKAAAIMGCYAANAPSYVEAASEYAEKIGLAFQITDDILDVTSTTDKLGKPVGSDADNQKSTYVSHYGLEKSRSIAMKLTADAKKALYDFGDKAVYLNQLADYLVTRDF